MSTHQARARWKLPVDGGDQFAVESAIVEPVTGPQLEEPDHGVAVVPPRIARHQIPLDDGHMVGISVSGSGVPLVVVHGYGAEGFLYAQTLSRLSSMGFKVVAIDTAGHGGTQSVPYRGGKFEAYSELLAEIVEYLGIRKAVYAGHSMGGRLATEFAAHHPDRTIALVLVDAIVGDTWDRIIGMSRVVPPVFGGVGILLLADAVVGLPILRDPGQAFRVVKLSFPTLARHAVQPWRLLAPTVSLWRSTSTKGILDQVREGEVPVFVLHGDRDIPVPHRTGRDTARRTNGTLVTIRGGTHSWLLGDPETLPAVLAELLDGDLGEACRSVFAEFGLAEHPTDQEIEEALYEPGARILGLSPSPERRPIGEQHRKPHYHWETLTDRGVQRSVEDDPSLLVRTSHIRGVPTFVDDDAPPPPGPG